MLEYPDFEIIVLPDLDASEQAHRLSLPGAVPVRVIPTGPVGPAQKRDLALNYAKGDILAFIDDDAYPVKDWLKNAVTNFSDEAVAAVGGPAITPAEDSFRQKASGLVYSSVLVSDKFIYRYLPQRRQEVDDYPSCNLLVRKSVFKELGGFNTSFWPGEDTKLCLDITKKLGKKIIYEPKAVVYHHRRPLYAAHLKQVASYALHRGYFVKRYPANSLKISYFVPALFVLAVAVGWILSLFFFSINGFFLSGMLVYLAFVFLAAVSGASSEQGLSVKLSLFFVLFISIILTHLTYGVYFFKGLLSKRLSEEGQGQK